MEINLQGVQMNSLILSPSAKKYQLIALSSETVITDDVTKQPHLVDKQHGVWHILP